MLRTALTNPSAQAILYLGRCVMFKPMLIAPGIPSSYFKRYQKTQRSHLDVGPDFSPTMNAIWHKSTQMFCRIHNDLTTKPLPVEPLNFHPYGTKQLEVDAPLSRQALQDDLHVSGIDCMNLTTNLYNSYNNLLFDINQRTLLSNLQLLAKRQIHSKMTLHSHQ